MVTELRQALRRAAKRPGFALTVVLTLALGIGANTTVFTLINAIVLRPLPYPDADDLFLLLEQDSIGTQRLASFPTFEDWRADVDAFEGVAYARGATTRYETDDQSGLLIGAYVTEGFFLTMRVPAALGRSLVLGDHEPGAERVGVLSHDAWVSWFNGDSSSVGQVISTATGPITIVGVMPPTFDFPDWGAPTHLWLPMSALPPPDLVALRQRDFHADSRVIARVRPGESMARGRRELEVVAGRLATAYPLASGSWTGIAALPLKEITVGDVRLQLLLFGAAVIIVLLICCFNLANLYLVQGVARRQEFAIRVALGAGRSRIARQLLTESLLLAMAGGAVGIVTAAVSVRFMVARGVQDLPRLAEVTVDSSALAFAVLCTVGSAILFALAGVWRSGSATLNDVLGGRAEAGGSTRVGRLPGWLQSAQVGLTFVLLVGAALLTQSFLRMSHEDLGFDPERLVQIQINPPTPTYDDADAVTALYAQLLETVTATPGVKSAALVNHAPPSFAGAPTQAAIGGAPTGGARDIRVLPRTVSAGYFSVLGIPILAGREFDSADINGPPGPLIINEALARRWADQNPIGQSMGILRAARTRPDFGEPLVGRVVGVVGDITRLRTDIEPQPMVYLPYTHDLWPEIKVVAWTEGAATTMLAAIENAVRIIGPTIPTSGPFLGASAKDATVSALTASQRFAAAVVGGFAAIALMLAAIGMYGVIAYTVTLETHEIGVRLAIGATPSNVLRSVLARIALITIVGLVAGAAAALVVTRFITSLLYQADPADPGAFAIVAGLLILVGAIAGYIPARRAARVDPIIALRAD